MFYNIGGITIEVSGERADDVLGLRGFNVFKAPCDDDDDDALATIKLVEEYDDFAEDTLIYSLDYDEACFSAFKRSDSGYGFKIIDSESGEKLSVSYDKGSSIAVIGGKGNPMILLFAMWLAYAVLALQHKLIAVHTSVIMYEGKAVMFLGESGTGKSTHTRLWRENIEGASLLNDDSPILEVSADKVYAYGSPWSGKTPCFRTEKAELVGIVRLSQAPHNKIRPLRVLDAFTALYPSCPPAFANDNFLSGLVCSIVSDTLSRVKVWHLECLPNADAAKLSFNTIFGNNENI